MRKRLRNVITGTNGTLSILLTQKSNHFKAQLLFFVLCLFRFKQTDISKLT